MVDNPYGCITIILYLLDFHRKAQLDFLKWAYRGGVEIFPVENDALKRIRYLMEKYSDSQMDFADACLVYLAEQLRLNTVVTTGRDFEIYRIKVRKRFKAIDLRGKEAT